MTKRELAAYQRRNCRGCRYVEKGAEVGSGIPSCTRSGPWDLHRDPKVCPHGPNAEVAIIAAATTELDHDSIGSCLASAGVVFEEVGGVIGARVFVSGGGEMLDQGVRLSIPLQKAIRAARGGCLM